ncbi:neopullulanase [Vibrio variabilis]|uniref:Neopullulanase n=1 Tax=Vibrio variabilis TaxID=990271 RepID=A0ABQ0JJ56_9VIBR|nr:neopullulanase [Vibrio variabilis]
MDDAKKLVEEAHKRGLYVFFDGVLGHHKDNVVASPSGNLPVGSSNPVSYPESLPFYKEVAEYWIKELKIDGWRLDQAYQVPTDAWAEIRKAVDETSKTVTYTNSDGDLVNPLGYMVAEIWMVKAISPKTVTAHRRVQPFALRLISRCAIAWCKPSQLKSPVMAQTKAVSRSQRVCKPIARTRHMLNLT